MRMHEDEVTDLFASRNVSVQVGEFHTLRLQERLYLAPFVADLDSASFDSGPANETGSSYQGEYRSYRQGHFL